MKAGNIHNGCSCGSVHAPSCTNAEAAIDCWTIEPGVLLMDEPFGALDALTRASLQDELIRIVNDTQSTVVMVTHDVDEAILLSDRIVMMTNGPAAKIGDIVDVNLRRPRDRIETSKTDAYGECRRRLLEFLYLKQARKAS